MHTNTYLGQRVKNTTIGECFMVQKTAADFLPLFG